MKFSKEAKSRELLRAITVKVQNNLIKFLVAMRLGDTPVLIPNTMVKT